MIIEEKIYTVECDCCNSIMDSDISPLFRESDAEEAARCKGWLVTENSHYCPNCWDYDDNGNVVINN